MIGDGEAESSALEALGGSARCASSLGGSARYASSLGGSARCASSLGGAREGCTQSASRAATWARIRWMRSGVSMHAMTRSVARHTVLDVDMEDSLERLHPVHGGDVVTGVTRCIGRIDPLMR